MFFYTQTLKRLIKSVFDSPGLTVAHPHDGYVVAAESKWVDWLDISNIAAMAKAVIVELAGKILELGKTYKTTKEKLQDEMPSGTWVHSEQGAPALKDKGGNC